MLVGVTRWCYKVGMSSANDERYYTPKEAAAIARIHVRTLYGLIRKSAKGPPFGRVNRTIRLPTTKFHQWLQRRK